MKCFPVRAKKSVSVGPGHSASTRTPDPRVSCHRASLKDKTKALLAAYTAMLGIGWNAAVEATLMTRPCWACTIGGRNRAVRSTRDPQLSWILSRFALWLLIGELSVGADPGVVNEDVDGWSCIADLLGECGRRAWHRQVGGYDVDTQASVPLEQSGAKVFESVRSSRDEQKIDAMSGELDGEFLADPATGAGDQRGFVGQVHDVLECWSNDRHVSGTC
jgi:hypothetical protein